MSLTKDFHANSKMPWTLLIFYFGCSTSLGSKLAHNFNAKLLESWNLKVMSLTVKLATHKTHNLTEYFFFYVILKAAVLKKPQNIQLKTLQANNIFGVLRKIMTTWQTHCCKNRRMRPLISSEPKQLPCKTNGRHFFPQQNVISLWIGPEIVSF